MCQFENLKMDEKKNDNYAWNIKLFTEHETRNTEHETFKPFKPFKLINQLTNQPVN